MRRWYHSPLWRSVVVKAFVPFVLVLAGAGSTVGGEAFEAAALRQQAFVENAALHHDAQSNVAPTPDIPKDSRHYDCPPALREEFKTLGLLNDLHYVHRNLEAFATPPPDQKLAATAKITTIDSQQEAIDLSADRLEALLKRLAPCDESEPKG